MLRKHFDGLSFTILKNQLINNKKKSKKGHKYTDVIKIFAFSCVRGRYGFNNNPIVTQFRNAIKQILMKYSISTSVAANCIALNNDYIGSIYEFKWTRKCNIPFTNEDIKVNVMTFMIIFLIMTLPVHNMRLLNHTLLI